MRACPARAADLHAHHDGQLGPLRTRGLTRHLAHCQGCRAELARLGAIGLVLREDAARVAAPDLWSAIAPRLADVDRQIANAPPPGWARWREAWRERRSERGWSTPIGVGAALALAGALALALWPAAPPIDVVRSLDTQGHGVVVLPGKGDATIIWVMDDDLADAVDAGDPATL